MQHLLSGMPHLSPALATGHILMQNFMDALFCQVRSMTAWRSAHLNFGPGLQLWTLRHRQTSGSYGRKRENCSIPWGQNECPCKLC